MQHYIGQLALPVTPYAGSKCIRKYEYDEAFCKAESHLDVDRRSVALMKLGNFDVPGSDPLSSPVKCEAA
jgi:hypothetical protein